MGGQQSGSVNTRKKHTLCGIRSDIMATIPYNIPNNTSNLLIDYLSLERDIGERMFETYKNNQRSTASAFHSFVSAPSWMHYQTDNNGNILMSDSDINKLKANNRDAADKTTDAFLGFLEVVANSYTLRNLQIEYSNLQNKLNNAILDKYGEKIGNVLMTEFSIHCGSKEAEDIYEDWFVKEYIVNTKTNYSPIKIDRYKKQGRDMDRYKMLLDGRQLSENEKTDLLINSANTGRLHMMRLFLSRGVNPNRTNSYGISAKTQLKKEGNGYIQSEMRKIINK